MRTHHHLGGKERPVGCKPGNAHQLDHQTRQQVAGKQLVKVQLLGSAERGELSWEGGLEKSSCGREPTGPGWRGQRVRPFPEPPGGHCPPHLAGVLQEMLPGLASSNKLLQRGLSMEECPSCSELRRDHPVEGEV